MAGERRWQWFTDVGHPALQRHLGGLIALMRISKNWPSFMRKVESAYREVGETGHLDLNED